MVKVFQPLKSERARGWLGRWFYGRRGVVNNPYPIGRYGLGFNISHYYSRLGWCYQVRRTWHGFQNVALRPPIHENAKTPAQQAQQGAFANAVAAWQGMDNGVKDYYNKCASGEQLSGYNLFISRYLTGEPV